jgi:hypothetical protein
MVYFLTRLDCQSNAKPSEKDHDLPGTRTRDLWSSSQHTQPLHLAPNLGFNYSHLQNEDKEHSPALRAYNNLFGLMELRKKYKRRRSTGAHRWGPPIFITQLNFDPTVWTMDSMSTVTYGGPIKK